MKYLVRAIKYFFYFSILCSLIIGALVFIGAVEGNIDTIFRGGWMAVLKMALLFAGVAAIYPKIGFITRDAVTAKPWKESREEFISLMKERNYELESENDQTATFRYRGIAGRISRMFEDRITVSTSADGIVLLEGLRKDVLRLCMAIENRFRPED